MSPLEMKILMEKHFLFYSRLGVFSFLGLHVLRRVLLHQQVNERASNYNLSIQLKFLLVNGVNHRTPPTVSAAATFSVQSFSRSCQHSHGAVALTSHSSAIRLESPRFRSSPPTKATPLIRLPTPAIRTRTTMNNTRSRRSRNSSSKVNNSKHQTIKFMALHQSNNLRLPNCVFVIVYVYKAD